MKTERYKRELFKSGNENFFIWRHENTSIEDMMRTLIMSHTKGRNITI